MTKRRFDVFNHKTLGSKTNIIKFRYHKNTSKTTVILFSQAFINILIHVIVLLHKPKQYLHHINVQ